MEIIGNSQTYKMKLSFKINNKLIILDYCELNDPNYLTNTEITELIDIVENANAQVFYEIKGLKPFIKTNKVYSKSFIANNWRMFGEIDTISIINLNEQILLQIY